MRERQQMGKAGGWRTCALVVTKLTRELLEFAIAQARVVEPQVRQPRRRRALQRQHADVGGVRRLPRFRFPGARRHRRRRRRRPRRVLEFTHAGEAIGGEGTGGDVAGQAEVTGRAGDESGVVDRGEDGCGEGGERGGWEGGGSGHRAHQLHGAVGEWRAGGGRGGGLVCGDERKGEARAREGNGRARTSEGDSECELRAPAAATTASVESADGWPTGAG